MSGYLYCFENECMPGLLKIGYTDRTVEERLKEANASGTFGPPSDYSVVFAKLVNNPKQKESIMHTLLKKYRKNPKKEFFAITKEYVKLLFDLLEGEWWIEEEFNEEQEDDSSTKILHEFLNDHIFPSTSSPPSAPITTKLLLESFSNWKVSKNYTFQIKGVVQLLQKLIRDTYGPPTSKGWTQIKIENVIIPSLASL
jgi:hypothetical protein